MIPPRLPKPPHAAPLNSLMYNASSAPTTNTEIMPGAGDAAAAPNPTGAAGGVIVAPSSTCAADVGDVRRRDGRPADAQVEPVGAHPGRLAGAVARPVGDLQGTSVLLRLLQQDPVVVAERGARGGGPGET